MHQLELVLRGATDAPCGGATRRTLPSTAPAAASVVSCDTAAGAAVGSSPQSRPTGVKSAALTPRPAAQRASSSLTLACTLTSRISAAPATPPVARRTRMRTTPSPLSAAWQRGCERGRMRSSRRRCEYTRSAKRTVAATSVSRRTRRPCGRSSRGAQRRLSVRNGSNDGRESTHAGVSLRRARATAPTARRSARTLSARPTYVRRTHRSVRITTARERAHLATGGATTQACSRAAPQPRHRAGVHQDGVAQLLKAASEVSK